MCACPADITTRYKPVEKMDVKEASAKFWVEFQAELKALQDALEKAGSNAIELGNLKRSMLALEKRVMDASIFLPAYDQRQCNLQLQSLTEKLGAASKPRSKFSFGAGKTRTAGTASALSQKTSVPENNPAVLQTVEKLSARGTKIVGEKSQHIRRKASNLAEGEDFYFENLENCFIDLRSPVFIGAIHAINVKNCVILTGVITGSVLLDGLTNCIFASACRQVDIDPAETSNRWSNVEDFNWLKKQASPNWTAVGGQVALVTSGLDVGDAGLMKSAGDDEACSVPSSPEKLVVWLERSFLTPCPSDLGDSEKPYVADEIDGVGLKALSHL
ncbi:hypothetical protein HDU67_001249 [Dinochytrium kinnereticum]|nr:hypothetical protein HDU67_001249 [Dinochytrium kinnereticum]